MKSNLIAHLLPADEYKYVEDTCIICAYYNPKKYKTKKNNFETFFQPIKRGNLNYLIVECSTPENKFELEESDKVIRVSSQHSLWQKERLLNIALRQLPKNFTKIVWMDCDVLFTNKEWLVETSELLNKYAVVQPYNYAIRLPAGDKCFKGEGKVYNGFSFIYNCYPNCLSIGDFDLHGHTGFAWAANREVIEEIGFYDACISGSGDHVMAHAFCGDWHGRCMERIFMDNKYFFQHFEIWCNRVYPKINGRLSYCKGVVLHLWHGDVINRKYLERMKLLSDAQFDPDTDLNLNKYDCWELNNSNINLIRGISEYFEFRLEDEK